MDRVETQKIINKIKTFRQTFLVEKDTVNNWLNVLKDYDYEEVNNKLDDYFKESKNFGQYPDPYYLTKYLIKTNEKFSMNNIMIKCSICGKKISQEQMDAHYDRCSSIDYIHKMYQKYYNTNIRKSELWELPNDTFDKMYWSFCNKLYNELPEGLEKKCLENAILSYKGLPIKYDLDELMEERLKGR